MNYKTESGSLNLRATFKATDEGAGQNDGSYVGGNKGNVLEKLVINGTSTIPELSASAGLSQHAVDKALHQLLRKQLVMRIGKG